MLGKYRLFSIILMLALSMVACGQVSVLTPPSGTNISSQGISFTIPTGLATATADEVVPVSNGLVMWPEHIRFTLQGYALTNKALEPKISIFPVDEYAQLSNESGTTLRTLQSLLKSQQVSASDMLPFLPEPRAQQMLHVQEKFINFGNGSGIRYITEYSQAAFPNIGSDMFYTFQGLTSDGKYYVSISLPIELPQLNGVSAPESSDTYPDYLTSTINLLNRADNTFNPSLESLDALVQSLQVQK
jgi:hypothetical protein